MAQPMSGSYTIGGANPDFSGLQQAMDTAAARGVSGPVEFVLRSGTYSGLYNFFSIPGTGPNSKVILRSENNDSSSVTINGFTTSNQTVMMRLYSLQYVEFHHLGFALQNSPQNTRTILISRGKHLAFKNCRISGFPSSSASPDFLLSGTPDTGLVVSHCHFSFGGGGLFVSNSQFSFRHALIENNVFDYLGSESIYVNGGAFAVIRNNLINCAGGGTTSGILMSGTSRYEISGNRIYSFAGTLNSVAIQLISSSGWPTQKSRIFNNVCTLNAGTTFVAYNFRASSSGNLEIFNNAFFMRGGLNAHVFYLQGSFSQNDEIDIYNNIFYRDDTISQNHIFRIPNQVAYLPYIRSNHNVFYSQAPVFNAEYSTFADYQAIGTDAQSIYANPQFVSDTILQFQNPLLENMGFPVSWLNTDINGVPRSITQPDPGPYETLSAPIAQLGQDTTACDSFTLFANANGAAILWSDGSSADSIIVTQSAWVSLTLSNAAGSSVDSVFVTIIPADPVSITASSLEVCAGTSVILNVNVVATGSFLWNDTLNTNLSRTVLVERDTVFAGIWTSFNACETEASVAINVFESPSLSFSLPDSIICNNSGVYVLSGGLPAGGVYGGVLVSNGVLDPSGAAGLFTEVSYTYTDSNTCSYTLTDSLFIDVCSSLQNRIMEFPGADLASFLQWSSAHPEVRLMGIYNLAGQELPLTLITQEDKAQAGVYIVSYSVSGKLFRNRLFVP